MTFLRSKPFKIAVVAFVVLLGLLFVLPMVLLPYVNRALSSVKGYDTKVDSLSLSFFNLSATVHKLKVIDKNIDQELLTVSSIKTKVLWSQLFKGEVLVVASIYKPQFQIALDDHVLTQLVKQTIEVASVFDWIREIRKMYPVAIDAIHINDGQARLIDRWKPHKPLTVQVTDIDADVTNLTNRKNQTDHLFASLRLEASVAKGKLLVVASTHPAIEKAPDFDMQVSVENIQLVTLNPFFREYGNFDFENGSLNLNGRLKANNLMVKGSLKPVLKDVKIKDAPRKQKEKGFFGNLWESLLQSTADSAKNDTTGKIETVIPISGRIDSANVSIISAIMRIFRKSLVGSIEPSARDRE